MPEQGFIFIADSHVDVHGIRQDVPKDDTLIPLQFALDYACAKGKPVVHGGDLYDRNLPPSWLTAAVESMLAAAAKHVPVYVIQGNHDKDPAFPWACHAQGVRWLDPLRGAPTDVGGYGVVGLDFRPAAQISAELANIPPCDVLVLHQALRQGLGFDGAWNCDLDWVSPGKCGFVLLGDLHGVADELAAHDRKVRAIYSLSQYHTDLGSTHVPGFVDVGPRLADGRPSYTRVAVPVRRTHDLSVMVPEDLPEAIVRLRALQAPPEGLPEALWKPVIHLRHPAGMLVDALLSHLKDRAYVIETAIATGSSTVVGVPSQRETAVTFSSLLQAMPPERLPATVRAFALDLSQARTADDVRGVIAAYKLKAQEQAVARA